MACETSRKTEEEDELKRKRLKRLNNYIHHRKGSDDALKQMQKV
jgi:hypothetical protein